MMSTPFLKKMRLETALQGRREAVAGALQGLGKELFLSVHSETRLLSRKPCARRTHGLR